MTYAKNCQYQAHIFITLVSNGDHVVILGGEEEEEVSDLFLKRLLFFPTDESAEKHTKLAGSKTTVGEVICVGSKECKEQINSEFQGFKDKEKQGVSEGI